MPSPTKGRGRTNARRRLFFLHSAASATDQKVDQELRCPSVQTNASCPVFTLSPCGRGRPRGARPGEGLSPQSVRVVRTPHRIERGSSSGHALSHKGRGRTNARRCLFFLHSAASAIDQKVDQELRCPSVQTNASCPVFTLSPCGRGRPRGARPGEGLSPQSVRVVRTPHRIEPGSSSGHALSHKGRGRTNARRCLFFLHSAASATDRKLDQELRCPSVQTNASCRVFALSPCGRGRPREARPGEGLSPQSVRVVRTPHRIEPGSSSGHALSHKGRGRINARRCLFFLHSAASAIDQKVDQELRCPSVQTNASCPVFTLSPCGRG